MYKSVEHKTVEELLLDAYKAQVSTYVRLLEVKDAQVASLEERIRELETRLNSYISDKSVSSTGLTAKEREEIAKLSKEIIDQPAEELEWPEEINMTIEIDNKIVTELVLNALGIKIDSKENTTTANSDVKCYGDSDNPMTEQEWLEHRKKSKPVESSR